jgi:paraquat-inducible protein B
MLKLTNTKVVGGFVLGALTLLIVAIVLFAGGALLRRTVMAVVYFQGSVNGLSVGTPVGFRGVQIGSVSNVILEVNAQTGAATIPVYLQLDPTKATWTGGEQLTPEGTGGEQLTPEGWQQQIERGLRAQLATQSLITGQLMVQLDSAMAERVVAIGVEPGQGE